MITIPKLPALSLQFPRKPYLKYLLLGFVFYIVFLIVNIPAEWLAWGLNKYSHGSVTLTQASGKIWQGRGLLSITQNRRTPVNLGRIKWNMHNFWLLIGQVDITLDLSGNGLHGFSRLVFSPGEIKLSGMRASIEANNLGSFYSPASLMSPTGQINISSEDISINDKGLHGEVKGGWQNAGSALSSVKPLGSYKLTLTGNGENAKIVLTTIAGSSLILAGKGNWTLVNGLVNFNGTATPAAHKSELDSLLSLLGRDLGGGKRILRFSTRIPFSYK